jgi:3-deoxy-manno-octulosonate cytidylyltransferase (CMP-KDO synthetase)
MSDPAGREIEPPCVVIIPARFASSRFPGKPLARLTGAGGIERSLIEWSWRAASLVPHVSQVLVATDDRRILDEVERFGGTAVMTSPECANGTERCAAALATLPVEPGIIVNFQGDAPLTPARIVTAVIDRMRAQPALAMATPAIPCSASTLRHLIDDRAAGRVGGTTMVFNHDSQALYFSKNIIPYVPPADAGAAYPIYLHLGVYAYRPGALADYVTSPPSGPELAEGLEQLRFLDMGVGVGAVVCEPPDGSMIELNNPGDVAPIEDELRRRDL